MTRPASAIFCDKIHEMKDGRHLLGGVWPGLVSYDGPPGGALHLDLFLTLKSDVPGRSRVEFMAIGLDGKPLALDHFDIDVADPRIETQVCVSNMRVPVPREGVLTVQVRPPGSDWIVAGRLHVRLARPAATARLGHAAPTFS